jgi:hypothetical protein
MATAPAPEFETPDFELDAGALSKEIAADANKSLEKYGQKKVRLTGIVSLAVTENKFSRIEFKGDGAAIVLCRLYGGNDDAVARMKPGQTVTVQGEFGTLGENFPHLYFCQIVKQ